jgi:hypothetical protein
MEAEEAPAMVLEETIVFEPPQRAPRLSGRPRSPLSATNQRHVSMMGLSTKASSPRWSMSGKPRTASSDRRPTVPDPGSYFSRGPEVTSKMSRSPNATFGSSTVGRKVLAQEKETNPGPGAYNHQAADDLGNATRQTSASISTPRLRERTSRQSTPDPGCYTTSDSVGSIRMGRSPSYGFASSRASRFPMLKDRAPGPGSYSLTLEIGRPGEGPSFFSTPRQREPNRAVVPDPGNYAAPDPAVTSRYDRSPRASFLNSSTGRLGEKAEKEGNPGPGQYHHKEMLGQEPGGTLFVRSPRRKESKPRNYTPTPDPGTYTAVDPTATSKMPRQVAASFGELNTGRIPENGATNGAAEANLQSPRRVRHSPKQDLPGPGHYNVANPYSVATTTPQWGFGTYEARANVVPKAAQQAPGPGHYVKQTAMGVGPKFTISRRPDDRHVESPGPGAYGGHWTQFS